MVGKKCGLEQKMQKRETGEQETWKKKAESLFFENKLSLQEISSLLNISRKSISNHFKTLTGYLQEKERRKLENKTSRQEYQRNWDRINRQGRYSRITGDTIRREHLLAASILSHEKF